MDLPKTDNGIVLRGPRQELHGGPELRSVLNRGCNLLYQLATHGYMRSSQVITLGRQLPRGSTWWHNIPAGSADGVTLLFLSLLNGQGLLQQ